MSAARRTNSKRNKPKDSTSGDFTSNLLNCIREGQELVLSSLKKVESTTESNVCYKCDKLFLSKGELVMHLKLIHNACATADCKNISDFRMHSSVCANRGFGCTVCNMKFTEKFMLNMHFNEHIGAAYYACDICRDGFQQRKDLQRHLMQVHNKKVCVPVIPSHSKPVYQKCGRCSKYYRLFAEFEEHTSLCCDSSVYACPICHINFTNSSELDEHKFAEHKRDDALKGSMALKQGKQYFCGVCYLGFSNGSTLKLHLATHVMEESFICDVCHSTFTTDDELQTHYLLHIEEHYVLHDVISQYSCNSCKKTFKTPEDLKNHSPECAVDRENSNPEISSPTKDGKKENSVCASEKENSSNVTRDETLTDASMIDITDILIYALKSGDDLMNCDDKQCIIVMDLQSVFVLQRGDCAAESRMPEVKDSIAYEENDTIDTSLLQNHMFQILSPTSEPLDAPSNIPIDADNVQCLVQNFNAESGAMESLAVNFEESVDGSQQNIIINDKICSVLVSSTEDSLNIENALNSDVNYGKSNTENVQEHFVPYCNDNSIIDDISDVHLLPEGSDVLNDMHICNICKQVFSTKTSLCLHMKGSHTGFDCYRCGNSFKSEEDLKSHEKVSHPSAFNCDLCEVSYGKEHLLRKHKHSAHGGKNFVCNICNKSYVLRNELDVHLMLHKGETPPTKCEYCGKIFASVSNYLRHKLIHEGKSIPKKYKCTVCDKGFIAKTPLQRHMSTHIRKSPLTYECPKCKMYFTAKQLAEHVESHNAP